MFVDLLFIYVNILTQSPPLNSERLHFKTPKPHLVDKYNLYIIDILIIFAFLVEFAQNISNRHICCRIILNRHIYWGWAKRLMRSKGYVR